MTLMTPYADYIQNLTRRHFLTAGTHLLGGAALATLSGSESARAADGTPTMPLTQHAAKAKQVIYLHMVGGPSQIDLYDYMPKMNDWYDKELPATICNGQR